MEKKLAVLGIVAYLLHHAQGGNDRKSRASILSAQRHAVRLGRARYGTSKYMPHQGVRECARRRAR